MLRLLTLCAMLAGAQLALAQAPMTPATPAAAAKPKYIMPPVCTAACHEPEANQLGGYFESAAFKVGSSRVDLQACKLEYSIVSPK